MTNTDIEQQQTADSNLSSILSDEEEETTDARQEILSERFSAFSDEADTATDVQAEIRSEASETAGAQLTAGTEEMAVWEEQGRADEDPSSSDNEKPVAKVVGVRFKPAGKVYDFDPGIFVLRRGDHVIVETEEGLVLGTVAIPPMRLEERKNADAESRVYKKVFRLAGEKDFEQREKNIEMEKAAHDFCVNSIKELQLDMNLFSVESTFDAGKLTFFFTADGRVDFRELVKQLVKEFHTRIEMRQVGIRNQAKMCGGIGRCGREICCSTFLEKFEPVSIRMAKEQNLSLNPTKISGLCGRLMCCLTFENETYMSLRENFPRIGQTVKIPDGTVGKISRHNVVCNRVGIRIDENQEVEIDLNEISIIG
jgi:cell fate regulator YaaT (PSP1 superfamily)